MNLLNSIGIAFIALGLFWWVSGVIMLTFIPTFVAKGTPFSAKAITVLTSGFILPWLMLAHGKLPMLSVLAPAEPTPELEKQIEQWQRANCPCPNCRARRAKEGK